MELAIYMLNESIICTYNNHISKHHDYYAAMVEIVFNVPIE